ncbi:MAG: Ig-like domain-containing protein, partial [Firmicutes bacterium]|nr:Ig-like domain-containing protein [Bacillota bacterium]
TAKATGDGTGFTWTTSDPTVATVSYNGTVTVVGVGRAKITATTTGNKKYNPEEASFIVKVYPDKVKQTKKPWTDGKKGQLKVRWGYQEGVTKYEIRYSTSKSFSTYSTKTVNAHGDSTLATQSTTLKNLKSGKTYYIKVRAVYQTYNEEGTKITYRGAWSPWRSAKTK